MTVMVNRYFNPLKYIIIFLPALGLFGSYLGGISLGFVNLFPFRIVILLFLPFSLLTIRWPDTVVTRSYRLLFGFWLVYGCLSLLWSPDVSSGVTEILAIGFGFSVGIIFVNLMLYKEGRIDWLRKGWVLAFLLTAVVAVWEVYTGNHLESSFSLFRPYYVAGIPYVQSTLGNPSNYGAFIVVCIPFLFWSLSMSKKISSKIFYICLIFVAITLILVTASRLALIGAVLELVTYWALISLRSYRRLAGYGIIFVLLVLLVLIIWPMAQPAVQSTDILIIRKFSALFDELQGGGAATLVRRNQVLNGLWMIYQTGGVGVGAGGFQATVITGNVPYSTLSSLAGVYFVTSDPHSLGIEIGSQYGLLVFIFFFLWIYHCGVEFIKTLHHSNIRKVTVSVSFLMSLSGFIIVSAANSTLLRQAWIWLYFASLLVAALYIWKSNQELSK